MDRPQGQAPTGLVLRLADAADAAAIADIHCRSRQATYRGLLPDDYLERRLPAEIGSLWDALLRELAQGAGVALLAERGAQAVGFVCVMAPDAEGSAYVDALHADPRHKGEGAGSALLDAAVGWARERGARRMHLLVVEGNDAAMGFYESRGWRRGERVHDTGHGMDTAAVRFELSLANAGSGLKT
jgi:GNAT superfamily N-acetyltransferase